MKLFKSIGLLFVTPLALFAQQANFQEIVNTNPSHYTAIEARGVSIADYDNDGDDDIFIAAKPSKLFRNDGNLIFTEVSLTSGLNTSGKLAVWVDVDDDGWLDLLVSGYDHLTVFHNNGNGSFTNVSSTGLKGTKMQVALMAGDLNGDHLLDIYTNNFKIDNQLFINYGRNQFRNKINGTGTEVNGSSMGGILFDFDDDNDLDIYLTFDGYSPNRLFINQGNASFQNAASLYNLDIKTQGMGIDIADFNHDGKYDFYVANLFDNSLLISNPSATFDEVAATAGVNDYGMGWGVVSFDYDNDGFSDVYINNEFNFSPHPNKLYRNNGNGSFTNTALGTALENRKSGFGCATGDFDSDGRLDLVVVNYGDKAVRIFNNQESTSNNWIEMNLIGTSANKFGVGAHIKMFAGGKVFLEDVTVGSGWYSQNSYRLHVGLNNASQLDSIIIRWPNGIKDYYHNLSVNTRYLAIQQESISDFDVDQYRQALARTSSIALPEEVPEDSFENLHEYSVARIWNEAMLEAIRNDFARPTVHARNLFHGSAAMYDAWAAYEKSSSTYFLDTRIGDYYIPFDGVPIPEEKDKARHEAISYASYRLIKHRFKNSPGAAETLGQITKLLQTLGYSESNESTNYVSGSPAALGNYIADQIIQFGLQDGSNEINDFANKFYKPVNPPLQPELPGNITQVDPNRWQPLKLQTFIDQNGNETSNSPPFLSAEWGHVVPFALKDADLSIKSRGGNKYWIYHDPGTPPLLATSKPTALSEEFKQSFLLVSVWSSHLDPRDNVSIDISPASLGNIQNYPKEFSGHLDFYNFQNGGDKGTGYTVNPRTGLPYANQIVSRGDYARVLAEFWADGPRSETPPGHWYTILNYVNYHPLIQKKFEGQGAELNSLEWDVKSYMAMGGALHDVAISAWGIKGYYDYTRPISALRYMAGKGQSSDPNQPRYHPVGIPLLTGYCELVKVGDPLSGSNGEHVGKVKLYAWRGPDYISNPQTDFSGVGWILAENWWPYQRPTFVTPPFAGYISGHSTYSSAAAEVLTRLTGDEYFPGGIGEFLFKKNEYLVFEEGPSTDLRLQWAKYKDAADQCSLSRIWGGIHPPIDDFPGRHIGEKIGGNAFEWAKLFFFGTKPGYAVDQQVLDVFPNPVEQGGSITIRCQCEILDIKIYDIMGREQVPVQVIRSAQRYWNISLSSFATGTYLIVAMTQGGKLVKRVIIR